MQQFIQKRVFLMKYFFIFCLMVFTTLSAKEYKVVFDCSSGNANYIKTRMALIEKTMNMIQEQGDKATVALTLHGKCVPVVSKKFEEVVDGDDLAEMQVAQDNLLHLLANKKVSVIACAMSLAANSIDQKDVLPMIQISKNSFINTIAYQNDGYALMTFK